MYIITHLEIFKGLDLKQKSIIRWTIDVDENTNFFHGIIKGNIKLDRINGPSLKVLG